MTTRPKKKKKKTAKGARKRAQNKSATTKAAARAKSRKTAKTRGKKPPRPRAAGGKATSAPKRVTQRRLALLSVSGRRAKSLPNRGPARGRVTARPRIARPAPRVPGVAIKAPFGPRYTEVLTPAALRFLVHLHREFEASRAQLLAAHQHLRSDAADTPESGMPEGASDSVIVDFADSRLRWADRIKSHIGLKDQMAGKHSPKLPSVLIVRPRGWDITEDGLEVDGKAIAAALFDFGLCIFHSRSPERAGKGLAFHLPLLEAEEGARLWQNVFTFVQDQLGLPDAVHAKAHIKDLLPEP